MLRGATQFLHAGPSAHGQCSVCKTASGIKQLHTAGIKLNVATAATSTVKETQIRNLNVCCISVA